MKLISARIENFRMLKDLKLDFSIDPDKPLTVIRAANETGKTTCLNALIWCLYGDGAFASRADYIFFPNDMASTAKTVTVSVEIDFQVETPVSIETNEVKINRYRLRRTVVEGMPSETGKPNRGKEQFDMHLINDSGTPRVIDSEGKRVIENALPESLKDVYFTDGDAALSFIDTSTKQGVKRQRVSNAIQSLLGLEHLESALKHVSSVARELSNSIDNTDYREEVKRIEDRIAWCDGEVEDAQEELQVASDTLAESEKELQSITRRVEEELKKGDKTKLVERRSKLQNQIRNLENSVEKELMHLAACAYSESLSKSILKNRGKKGLLFLKKLSDKKQLPKVNIPILEELLTREVCFCGTNLDANTNEGLQRHNKIKEAIQESQSSDRIQEVVSGIYYNVRSIDFDIASEQWKESFNDAFEAWNGTSRAVEAQFTDLSTLEKEINAFGKGDSQLEELRAMERQYRNAANTARSDMGACDSTIRANQEEISKLNKDLDTASKKMGRKDTNADKHQTAQLVKKVLASVQTRLKGEELEKVSFEMNRIFLEMIGSNPNLTDFSQITKAELTKDYDIVVYGASGVPLNTDAQLNGASRRAITLAFILSLTKVSQVEAPNVIDTPLGMMSGYVKQSCLNQTLKEGSQTILFLTHSEISGVENILNAKAGKVFTLTNPAHYPTMLKNKPPVNDFRILRCECDHNAQCEICERIDHVET